MQALWGRCAVCVHNKARRISCSGGTARAALRQVVNVNAVLCLSSSHVRALCLPDCSLAWLPGCCCIGVCRPPQQGWSCWDTLLYSRGCIGWQAQLMQCLVAGVCWSCEGMFAAGISGLCGPCLFAPPQALTSSGVGCVTLHLCPGGASIGVAQHPVPPT